jgi:drug/metabolite transporter (DMT)-like permease
MLLAGLLFAVMDAGMKWLAADYPPFQIAALRSFSALPLVLPWILLRGRVRTLLHVHWPLHLLRGVLGVAMLAGFVYGVARMPLSTAYAIVFVSPLLVTALAVPLLRERVGPGRWMAVFIGLLGVLVVLRPGMDGVASAPGLVLVLVLVLAAFCYAIAAFDWQPVQARHLWVLAVIGVTGAMGQVALTHTFRLGEASQVAPLECVGLVWAVMLDLAIWRALPDGVTWLGAAIIMASGLYIIRSEATVAAATRPPGELAWLRAGVPGTDA